MNDYRAIMQKNGNIPSQEILEADIANAEYWEDVYWLGRLIFDRGAGSSDKLIMDAYEKAFRLGLNIRVNREYFLQAVKQIAIIYFQFGKYDEVISKLMILDSQEDNIPDWVHLYFASAQIHTENILIYVSEPELLFNRIDAIDNSNQESSRRREYIFREFLNRISDLNEAGEIDDIDLDAIISKADELRLDETTECYRLKYSFGLIKEIPEALDEEDEIQEEAEPENEINYEEIIEEFSRKIEIIQAEADELKLASISKDRQIKEYKQKLYISDKELKKQHAISKELERALKESKAIEFQLKVENDTLVSKLAGTKEEKQQLEKNATELGLLQTENEELKNRILEETTKYDDLLVERDEYMELFDHAQAESIKFQEEMLNLRSAVANISSKLQEEKALRKSEEDKRLIIEKRYNALLNSTSEEKGPSKETNVIEDKVPPVRSFLNRNQKILIMGGTKVKEEHLRGKLSSLGFDFKKDDLVFALDYDNLDYYASNIKQYDSKYAGVIVGPCPHMLKSTDGYSSFIQKLKSEKGYPHVEEAMDEGGKLKLSKESFGKAMRRMATYLSSIC